MDRKKVLVIAGKNEKVKRGMFAFLRRIGLHPYELRRQTSRRGAPYPYEGIKAVFKDACAVLVLLTGDDEAKLKEQYVSERDSAYEKFPHPQPQANVLFEAGMAFAHRPNNTILVKQENLKLCSDLQGRDCIKLSDMTDWRRKLIKKLRDVGCAVDLSSPKWADTGDFSDPGT